MSAGLGGMRTVRVLLVDDEAPARARLMRLLAAEPDLEVVGEASSGPEAVDRIAALAPDLVLLDVQMPGMDGFEVVRAVGPESMPALVFVTAYSEHALRAFEANATDYLLKPVPRERMRATLQRVRERLAAHAPSDRASADVAARLRALIDAATRPQPAWLDRMLVEDGPKSVFLSMATVDWIEADRNVMRLHAAGRTYATRGTMGAIAERLDPRQFLRINRSIIVRLDAVRELHQWFHGDWRVVMHDGTTHTWSRRYRAKDGAAFEAAP